MLYCREAYTYVKILHAGPAPTRIAGLFRSTARKGLRFLIMGKKKIKNRKVNKRTTISASTSKSSIKVDKATRALKARHLDSVCAEIESLRASNGRIPRGELMKVNEQNKAIYSRLTIDIIKKCLKKRRENPVALDTTIISDLTEDSGATPTDNPPNLPPPSLIGVNNDQISDTVTEAPKRTGGRPKGATVCASREKEEQMSRLINEIASEWNEKVKVKPEKGRMKKNELERFIEEKKAEKGLTNVCISKSCI